MKKSVSVILCAVLMLAAIPLCTAGAANVQAAPSQSVTRQGENDVGYQPTALELILGSYLKFITYSPESMGEIITDIQDDLTGMVMVAGFGGFIYLPLLLPSPFLRLVIGIPKVIAANIRNSF